MNIFIYTYVYINKISIYYDICNLYKRVFVMERYGSGQRQLMSFGLFGQDLWLGGSFNLDIEDMIGGKRMKGWRGMAGDGRV